MASPDSEDSVLGSKREATSYRILVEIADRQPAVNQQEIADELGITSQSVSDYLGDLTDRGFVDKQARGRYEITNEGVDWLISRTDGLREFLDHVSSDVLDAVDVDTAVASSPITEGQRVTLTMQGGVLHATPREDVEDGGGSEAFDTGDDRHPEPATATAVTDASAGEDVGVTNFSGVIDYEFGTVTVVAVPPVQSGGSSVVDGETVATLATEHDLVAVDAPEAIVLARQADLDPDLQFGTVGGVRDAAVRGLDVLLLAVATRLSAHTDALGEHNVSYEVIDPVEERRATDHRDAGE